VSAPLSVGILASLGLVVDTDTKVSASEAKAMRAAGAGAVIRYGPLPGNSAAQDLDAVELAGLTNEDLVVVVVQHTREEEDNELSASTGAGDAQHLLTWCQLVGYVTPGGQPPVTLGLDMEGVKNPSGAFPHAQAWISKVLAAGYRAMVYVGFASGLTSAECDALAAMGDVRFWCDAGPYKLRPAPSLGFALKQDPPSTLAGVGVDKNDVLQPGVVWGLGRMDVAANDDGDPVIEVLPDAVG